MRTSLHLGKSPFQFQKNSIQGDWVCLEGENYYRISNYERMRPFFISVVSDADHWMFISSNGGLTAGRRDADHALFPYYTDDKIRDQAEITGSKTILRVRVRSKEYLWEPFSERGHGAYRIERNLFKNTWGNQLLFEEVNQDLGLTFRYGWFNSQKFGWVRRVWLQNTTSKQIPVVFLDGIQNLMPSGVGSQFNLGFSTLLDAYKRNELLSKAGLGIYRLSAIPVDRPEPAEALLATVAWSVGISRKGLLLSSHQLNAFRSGQKIRTETDVCGERGAYFLQGQKILRSKQSIDWLIAADVDQSSADLTRLEKFLQTPASLKIKVIEDIQSGTDELRRIVGGADGLQVSARSMASVRHYSNTLCNIMRGGVFEDGDRLSLEDLDAFVRFASPGLSSRWGLLLRQLPDGLSYRKLVEAVHANGDPQLERICREYLPLTFSRRHGDPSRPWNRFSIPSRGSDGRRILNYEGNWRDIFQNWEALAHSYPGYTGGMICRFLNASTADGYNPYRITRQGMDWEVPEAHDPWACIGYWGDHQIIYLLKLLEHFSRHDSKELGNLLDREIFAYANVPYRLRPYSRMVEDPKNTVVFDRALENTIQQRVRTRGADGRLLWDKQGNVRQVNFTEKLLVPLLAKLSNLIPEAGIWLNTQRPEWNDANNALVGQGTSVVTLAYIRRYLAFAKKLFEGREAQKFALSIEVAAFLASLEDVWRKHRKKLSGKISDQNRRRIMDDLGIAGTAYRKRLYEKGISSAKISVSGKRLTDFFSASIEWVDHTLRANRRKDGLYHSYNLMDLRSPGEVALRHLYEMLEGQVAILSSGYLSPAESLKLLQALKRSAIYRPDQHSYLLYPNRRLPRFVERNNLPRNRVSRSALLKKLIQEGNEDLVIRDVSGRVHFQGGITNARDLKRILEKLGLRKPYRDLARKETEEVLAIYESLFDHQSFTGRSGTFYGYEGLGCIYWHMVSKLLLAVQETYFQAVSEKAPAKICRGLAQAYADIRNGLGDAKSPEIYGAFPMDPYSHTPAQSGARQPGLTGQVKEDILCRWGELGVKVDQGRILLEPLLLRKEEFLDKPQEFIYCDAAGQDRRCLLPAKSIGFTLCQTLFVYELGEKDSLTIVWKNGMKRVHAKTEIDMASSRAIFQRTGMIERLEVVLGMDRWKKA